MIGNAAWLLLVPEPRFARELPTILPLPFRRGEGRGEGSKGSGPQKETISRGALSPPAGIGKMDLLSPTLSSLGGGEGEGTESRRLAPLIQRQWGGGGGGHVNCPVHSSPIL